MLMSKASCTLLPPSAAGVDRDALTCEAAMTVPLDCPKLLMRELVEKVAAETIMRGVPGEAAMVLFIGHGAHALWRCVCWEQVAASQAGVSGGLVPSGCHASKCAPRGEGRGACASLAVACFRVCHLRGRAVCVR